MVVIASSPSQRRRALASLLLTAMLLVVFLLRAPLGEVAAALAGIRPAWIAAAVGLALLSYILRALRWGVILRPLGPPPPPVTLIGSTAAGFAASTLLPARAGEVVRGLVIAARTGLPAAGTLASIVTERLVDLATVLVLFAGAAALAGGRVAPAVVRLLIPAAGLAAAGLAVGLAVVWLVLLRRESAVSRLSRLAPLRLRERFVTLLHHVMDGLAVLRNPGSWWRLGIWSLLVWLAATSHLIVLAHGFGIPLDLVQGLLVMTVSIVGLSVPTPGGVGGFHAATQFALINLLGVAAAPATAFAVLHHAVCFLPITVVGLAYLSRVGFSVRQTASRPPTQDVTETGG